MPRKIDLRAGLYRQIRQYFDKTGVLEVSTPVLSFAGNTDPAIASFQSFYDNGSGRRPLYLHTSPEFFMKRLLCEGSGSIYQLGPVFRQGEQGRYHNPEFTLLEWYRVGFDYRQLMRDVAGLIGMVMGQHPTVQEITYRELFSPWAVDPHNTDAKTLAELAAHEGIDVVNPASLSCDDWLDLIMTHCIEPAMSPDQLVFVYDYPQSQASLARCRQGDVVVAERFELYWGGMELANGFSELTNADEQRSRFMADNHRRLAHGLETMPIDERFLQALQQGMPECSGVALGVDRLLMILSGAENISEVLSFPFQTV